MKVHIISDIEGCAGIVKWEQTGGDSPLYQEGRKLYTEEINAAVRGATAAGATEIVVMDCHGAPGPYRFNSLIAEDLDPACEFVIQEKWTEYTAFLEAGCDAALFVGMHARAGTPEGVLNHTVSGTVWRTLLFNGVEVGETGINAALCGTWGCPVLLVTGDTATCDEGRELLGDGLTTVAVKQGTGRFGAAQPRAEARPRADRGGREERTPEPDRRAPVRSGSAVRDPRRLPSLRRARPRPSQAWRRGRRCAGVRLAGRRLVVGLAAVLLLAGCGEREEGGADDPRRGTRRLDHRRLARLRPRPEPARNLGFGADEKSQWEYWAHKEDLSSSSATAASTASAPTRSPRASTSAQRARRC